MCRLTVKAFKDRNTVVPQWFDVTITETLELTVRVEAGSPQEAGQIVSADWGRQEFTLGPECFAGVEFDVVPATEDQDKTP